MNLLQFVALRQALAHKLSTALVGMFKAFDSSTDHDIAAFTAEAVPLAIGARRTMADLTSTWVADQASTHTGIPVSPIAVPDTVTARPGVTPQQVYARPFITVRAKLSQGRTVEQAVAAGTARLEEVVDGDLQRAHSEAGRAAIQALPAEAKPVGWRRVLVGAHSCPMCVVAASQLYGNGTASPLHPRCDCSIALAYGGDLARSDETTAQLHAAFEQLTGQVGGASDEEIQAVLHRMTPVHGELGPMLVRPGQHFDGPSQVH